MIKKLVLADKKDLRFYVQSDNFDKVKTRLKKDLYKLNVEDLVYGNEPFKPEGQYNSHRNTNYFELQRQSLKIVKYFAF